MHHRQEGEGSEEQDHSLGKTILKNKTIPLVLVSWDPNSPGIPPGNGKMRSGLNILISSQVTYLTSSYLFIIL